MDLLPRLKELLQWSGLGPAAFADEIGVGRPVLSHIFSARNKVSLEVVQKILLTFPAVSPGWLLVGHGPMLTDLVDTDLRNAGDFLGHHNENTVEHDPSFSSMEVKIQKEFSQGTVNLNQGGPVPKELIKVILLYSDGSFANFNQ